MNPNQAGRALSQVGSAGGAAITNRPRLQELLDKLDGIMGNAHGLASDLDGTADRLMGNQPQDAAANAPKPVASTVEQRLCEIIALGEHLTSRLQNTSQRLNSAV